MRTVVTLQSWWKYSFGAVDWRGRDIRLVVAKPVRQENYMPAEEYGGEYLGDFRVTRDRNRIRKGRRGR